MSGKDAVDGDAGAGVEIESDTRSDDQLSLLGDDQVVGDGVRTFVQSLGARDDAAQLILLRVGHSRRPQH